MHPPLIGDFVEIADAAIVMGLPAQRIELMAEFKTTQGRPLFETLRYEESHWIRLAGGPRIAIVLAEDHHTRPVRQHYRGSQGVEGLD